MSRDLRHDPKTVAQLAMAYLGQTEDLLGVFVGSTGIAARDLAGRLEDPELLAAVLDFVLMEDDWVLGFASWAQLPPERVGEARRALPGGCAPDWT